MNSQGAKRAAATLRLWWSDIDSSDLALSLPHCAEEVKMGSTICNEKNGCASSPFISLDCEESARYRAQERTKNKSMKGETTEDKQDDELASEMTEELNFSVTVSKNGGQPKHDAVPYTKSIEKNRQALDRTGSGLVAVTGSGGESEGCGDLRMYSMSVEIEQVRRLRSSQYKGVVPQPNGRWGAQIYEKHQRVWLGTFSSEEEAARAYDRAALKVRGREAITNFSSVGSRDQEERFMREHSKEEIVQMLRKHTYDEEMTMRVAQSGTDKAEASGEVECGLISVCQENKEHLFDKALTPSDVGKLNRLVIPKQQAEKYFPMDVNSSENGLLLNFADNMGKVWRIHYSYWKSSQSYVLTKGWSRFVKEKKLEAEDIVSFHRGLTQSHQLYISWRRRPPGKQQFGASPQSHHSKWKGTNCSSSLDPFNYGNQAGIAYNGQWMPLFWPTCKNLDTIQPFSSNSITPLVNKVGDADALWSPIPITTLYVALPFHCSESSTKQTDINRGGLPSMDLYLNLHNSINSGDGSPHIKPLGPSAAKELETPEHKEVSCLDSATATTTTEGIKLFGVTLSERQIYREVKSEDSQGQLRV